MRRLAVTVVLAVAVVVSGTLGVSSAGAAPAKAVHLAGKISSVGHPVAGGSARFTLSATLPAGDKITGYSIGYGDHSATAKGKKLPKAVNHVYRRVGRYTLTFTITDKRHQTAKTTTKIVVLSPPPAGGGAVVQTAPLPSPTPTPSPSPAPPVTPTSVPSTPVTSVPTSTSPPSGAGTAPSEIALVSAVAGDGSATLSFAAPESNGSPISGYQVSTNGAAYQPLAADDVVHGLTNASSYSFQVVAVNAVGPGLASPASNAVIPWGPPLAPSLAVSVVTSSSITWTWRLNMNGGGLNGGFLAEEIINYDIDTPVSDLGVVRSPDGTESLTATGLGCGQTHELSVETIATYGISPFATVAGTTTPC